MCNLSPNKYAMVLQVNNNEQPNKQKEIKQNIQIKWQKKCLLSSEDEGVREVGGPAFYKGSNRKKKHIICIKISYISGIVSAAKHLTVNI